MIVDEQTHEKLCLALGKIVWEVVDNGTDAERSLARRLAPSVSRSVTNNIYVLITHRDAAFDPNTRALKVSGQEPTVENLCPLVRDAFRALAGKEEGDS